MEAPTEPAPADPPVDVAPLVIEWSVRYNARTGFSRLNVGALSAAAETRMREPLKDVVERFLRGQVSERDLADALITALFARDFYTGAEHGKHWDSPGTSIKEVFEDKSQSDKALLEALWPSDKPKKEEAPPETPWRLYHCERKSEWDWKDIYAVASSRAVIAFSPDRTKIEIRDYGHNCSG
mmetsp:Transcript_54068/g.132190  ORF Transcript_54068/g.132190 Transcript_54068/m.132190 type:complete len:182 (-) Transcript_54068:223-768(-)